MSKKWKSSIILGVMMAAASCALTASAQVRTSFNSPVLPDMPLSSQEQQSAPPSSSPTPIRQQMPAPGTGETPVLKIRINPATIVSLGIRPSSKETDEGFTLFFYNRDELTHERILDSRVVGRYTYDRNGRFERLDYSDGISITPEYGDDDELRLLTSNTGRSIAFTYDQAMDGSIARITPTNENNAEFHSAVALLRMKVPPPYWPTGQMSFRADDDEVEKNADGGGKPEPQYPGSPMPGAPTAPGPNGAPIPSIPVSAPRLPTDDSPPAPPIIRNGVDFVPTGGPRGGSQPSLPPIKDLIDLARREALIQQCKTECNSTASFNLRLCAKGPTPTQRYGCAALVLDYGGLCKTFCDLGDITHEFRKTHPEPDYFPWENTPTAISQQGAEG